MRKKKQPVGPTYAIDTSTWLRLEERGDIDKVWHIFLVLIHQKRLVTAPEVLKELAHPDYKDTSAIYKRVKPFERDICHRQKRDQQFHDWLGRLYHNFPQLCHTRSRKKRPGDPYLIATAKRSGFTVVSEETLAKRPSRKIPHACVTFGVRCLTIDELMAEVKATMLDF